jgi:exodeoxyribonuclease X
MQNELIFLDTETTGLGTDDRLVQVACRFKNTELEFNQLFNPMRPISFEAMSVSHITNEDVEERELFRESALWTRLDEAFKGGAVLVAHNAPFDTEMLKREGLEPTMMPDTQRLARHLFEVDRYNLQYLRYALGLYKNLDPEKAVAHDAWGDVLVLEQLFGALVARYYELNFEGEQEFKHQAIMEDLLRLSTEPVMLKALSFGKYNGVPLSDLVRRDQDYLDWLYHSERKKEPADQNKDLLFTLKNLLHGNSN